jgi:hypothetical protein
MLEPSHTDAGRLICGECGRESEEHARGWHGLVLSDDDELPLQDDEVALFCAECWEREFGEQS